MKFGIYPLEHGLFDRMGALPLASCFSPALLLVFLLILGLKLRADLSRGCSQNELI